MKKRIAFLTDIPEDTGSWIGRYEPWIKYLRLEGYEVTAFLPAQPYFRRVNNGRRQYGTLRLLWVAWGNLTRTLGGMWEATPDTILLGKPLPVSSVVAIFFRLFFRKELIVDCDDHEGAINTFRSPIQKGIVLFFEWATPFFAHKVVVHTSYGKERLIRRNVPARKIFFLLNGVDPERFIGIDAGAGVGARTICYCGDLNAQSGHAVDLLLEAFAEVLKVAPDTVLWIVGDGKDAEVFRDIALDLNVDRNIRWWGRVSPQDVPAYLSRASVVVDPVRNTLSNLYRCPLKVIEALYLGKQVVTGDIGDRKELLNGKGILVRSEEPKDWAAALLQALRNPVREESPKERFSWKGFVKEFEISCLIPSNFSG